MAGSDESQFAPFATRSSNGGQRAHAEPQDPLRTPFELDRHRIIECTAFRRLEGKTQVFAPSRHDHFRTRLTHTLEVAQIARCLAGALRANDDLAEAIAFAHDLGHPPFGHAGESALNEVMRDCGGFNHNTHSLRVVEYLEHPFPSFRGLNLTLATRDGLRRHTTPYDEPEERDVGSPPDGPESRGSAGSHRDGPYGSVEAQAVSLADRIAYTCHDLEDAVGAGWLDLHDLAGLALWKDAWERVAASNPPKHIHAVRRLVLDAILDAAISDAVSASRVALASASSPDEAGASVVPLVALSEPLEARLAALEELLLERVYRRQEIVVADADGRRMIAELFGAYRRRPEELPSRFSARIEEQGLNGVICDYIAGMTDRFCIQEHARIIKDG